METPLETYRRVVAEQPACDVPLFAESLTRFHAGEPSAARTISGSCLRLALRMAEEHTRQSPALPLLDVIQEANAGLMEAITTFPGRELDEFLQYAQERIRQRLTVLA